MKIQLEPKDWPDVFDHPEYCNGGKGRCQFLNKEEWDCVIFDSLEAFAPGKYLKFKKHNKCKLAYMNAHNRELT